MGTPIKRTRYRRVSTLGIPELADAVSRGLVTLYRAGEIARLAAEAQKIALAQWSERARQHREGQAIAASCLRRYLAQNRGRVDLGEICSFIRESIRTGR